MTEQDASTAAMVHGEATPAKMLRIAAAVLLAALAVALYLPNVNDYFIGDDFDLILSFHDKPPSYFLRLLAYNESGDVWKTWGIDPELGRGFIRPLKIWMLKLDFELWGTNPLGYHLTCAVFFVGVILLVHRLLLLLTRQPIVAFAGTCVACIHPVFSEVVPFITAREDTLVTALGLGAFVALVRHRRGQGPGWLFHLLFIGALLTKESGIGFAALAGGYDLVHGRLWPHSRAALRDLLRFYLPVAAIIAGYFGLRYLAFGNFKGGDAFETGYASLAIFERFHTAFFRSLFDPTMLSIGGRAWVAPLVVLLVGAAIVAALVRWSRISSERRRDLLFFGPLWYLATTAVLFGSHFALRRISLPLIGLVVFATLLIDTLCQAWNVRHRWVPVSALLLAAAALFVPPTLRNVQEVHRASVTVREIRQVIDAQTQALPDGCNVLLTDVPQWEVFPYYFGWALQSALRAPFTPTDLSVRCTVIEKENLRLNRARPTLPDHFDLTLSFQPERFITPTDRERWVGRLRREGVLPREGALPR